MLPLYLRPLRLLALVGLTTACAPTYHLTLEPAQRTNLDFEGREQARALAPDSVEVRLSFVCFEASRMVFEAVYRNPSQHDLVVAPAAFQYEARRLPAPPAASGQKVRRPKPLPGARVVAAVGVASQGLPLPPLPTNAVSAFDPEPEITALHDRAEQEAAKAARIDWFGVALSVATIASDMSSIGRSRETYAQAKNRAVLHDAAVTYSTISAATKIEHAVAADVLQQRAANLQDYALRKVTLAPGQQVRGYLYFPRFNAADGFVVKAPVGNKAVPLEFVQTWTRQ